MASVSFHAFELCGRKYENLQFYFKTLQTLSSILASKSLNNFRAE